MRSLLLSLTAGLALGGLAHAAPSLETRPEEPVSNAPGAEQAKPDRMDWWREARFGMFIHWGLYSAFEGEYHGKRVNGTAEWIMQNAKIPVSEYETIATKFNPVKYDAEKWVAIAKDAGMKYIVITSKHHDGFALWDSAVSDWDVARTPYGKDLLMPLKQACDKAGITFCLYHSIMDWHHPDYIPRRQWNDVAAKYGPPDFKKFVPYLHAQVGEIITRYQPGILWFDGEWEETWTSDLGADLEAHVRKLKPDIIINNRVGKARNDMAGLDKPGVRKLGDYGTPEQEIPARGLPGVDWETCMTMNDTWGWAKEDHNWKPASEMIRMLCDIASKGGNYLLNVGPTPEGEIPGPSVERLRDIGKWTKVNGEAIYGTTASPFTKLAWGRATQKPGKLYLHVFDWPKDGTLRVPMKNAPTKAYLLSDKSKPLAAKSEKGEILITVPTTAPDAVASVVVVEFSGAPDVPQTSLKTDASGAVALVASEADIVGHTLRVESKGGKENLGYWMDAADSAKWTVQFDAPGEYKAVIEYACEPGAEGSEIAVAIDSSSAKGAVGATAGWADFKAWPIGTVRVEKAGPHVVVLKALNKKGLAVANIRSITLTRAK